MNTVQPIRNKNQISAMKAILKNKDEKYYMLFTLGVNCGLRVSDILKLKVYDIYDTDHVTVTEKKTGKRRRFLLNTALQRELMTYVERKGLSMDEYLFQSRKGYNKPITRTQAYRVLNSAGKTIGLSEIGTHSMRKTFGYHHYKKHRDVAMLQDMFNHSSPQVTLRYIGINDDMKDDTLKEFFL